MERRGEKPTPRIVVTEEQFTIPTDAMTQKGKKVVAEIPISGGRTLAVIEETFTVDMKRAIPVTQREES